MFSKEKNSIMISIHRPTKGFLLSTNFFLRFRIFFSQRIDFVFPTDETSSTAIPLIKRDKTSTEKLSGRVWNEFNDIKQVLAGISSLFILDETKMMSQSVRQVHHDRSSSIVQLMKS